MSESTIEVVVRQRPPDLSVGSGEVVVTIDADTNSVSLANPRAASSANQEQNFKFAFNKALGPESSQTDVFRVCGEPTVAGVLDGYNATIMAYGQTGAGKTFTINGGGGYDDRGLAPRVISHLFGEITRLGGAGKVRRAVYYHPGLAMLIAGPLQVGLSYMEIHNEHMYDLLQPAEEEDKPLTIVDDHNCTTVRGLSINQCVHASAVLRGLDRGACTTGAVARKRRCSCFLKELRPELWPSTSRNTSHLDLYLLKLAVCSG